MDSSRWLEHFRANRHRPDAVPPDPAVVGPADLAAPLREALVRSLQRFQLGEAGEGRVAHEAATSDDPALDDALRECVALYVREEGRHAREVAALLRSLGADTLPRHRTEVLFTRTRRALGLRTKMLTIAVAEVVGVVFYGLVRDRVPHAMAARVTALIAADEKAHLDFQFEYFARVLAIDQRSFLAAVKVGTRGFVGRCLREVAQRVGAFRAPDMVAKEPDRSSRDLNSASQPRRSTGHLQHTLVRCGSRGSAHP